MAKTHGHGNPDWSRDEVILALDLYLSCGGTVPGASDPRVEALSKILRDLSVHPASSRVGSFRNPDGVSFKLQNIRQVASGKGLENVSRVDREVWAAYGDKPAEVKRLAAAILSLASPGSESTESDEGEDIFVEGGVLTAYRHRRERSPKLRKAVLAKRSNFSTLTDPQVAEIMLGHRLPGSWQVYDRYDYLAEQAKGLQAWTKRLEAFVAPSADKFA